MILSTKPTIHEIGYKTYVINCYGMQSPVLVVGERGALLIDTGGGNYDLKSLIEGITDVPLTVVVTHSHADHISGIVQFDRIYTPEREISMIKSYREAFIQRFLDYFIGLLAVDGEIGYFKADNILLPWDSLPELIPIKDGFQFALGGRNITAYDCPTHTAGHMVFIDDLTHTLFAGDAIEEGAGPANNPINPPEYISLETIIRGLENIKGHSGEFNRIIPGHMGWGGNLNDMRSLEPSLIDRLLDVGRKIMNNTIEIGIEDSEIMGRRGFGQLGSTKLYFFPQYLHDADL